VSGMVVFAARLVSLVNMPSRLTVMDGEEPLLETSESWGMDRGKVGDVIEGGSEFHSGLVGRDLVLLEPDVLVSNCDSMDSRILDGSARGFPSA